MERARALWIERYKKKEEEMALEEPEGLSYLQRRLKELQAKQRRSKGLHDEFERFIQAPSNNINGSAIDWWLQDAQQSTYPQLSHMAIDILSAPLMSAESERVFSGTRRTIA